MRIGIIGRFQPLHLGHEQLLNRYACDDLTIAIGSVNRNDERNPLTYDEREALIERAGIRARIVPLEDDDDYASWIARVRETFEGLDALVSGNPLVEELLGPHYRIVHPFEAVSGYARSADGSFPKQVMDSIIDIDASRIRAAIRSGEPWQRYVSEPVSRYLAEHGIDKRIRSN